MINGQNSAAKHCESWTMSAGRTGWCYITREQRARFCNANSGGGGCNFAPPLTSPTDQLEIRIRCLSPSPFSGTGFSTVPPPGKSDVSFYRKSKMTAGKMEAAITFKRLEITMLFQFLPPHFRPGPTWIWHCRHRPTFRDVGGRPNSKWRPRKPEMEITIQSINQASYLIQTTRSISMNSIKTKQKAPNNEK